MDQDNAPPPSWKTEMKEMIKSFKDEITDEIMSQFKTTADLEPQKPESEESDNLEEEQHSEFKSSAAINTSIINYLENSKSSFEDLVEEFATTEKTGPAVHKKLAKMVEELIKGKLPKPKLEEIINKYPRPENCTLLVSPKGNRAVWNQLTQKCKTADRALQKAQSALWLQ